MNKHILAVASNGGHLVQLMRLFPAFDGNVLSLISTSNEAPKNDAVNHYYCVTDSNFDQKLRLIKTAFETMILVVKLRPDVIISTGAAPGLFCIIWGKVLRKKVIWIDSIANTEKLSMAGRVALKVTTHCYTQWPLVSKPHGPHYIGSVV
jgi:UDP-N-acetylglucosamine:LPS N-acetylglucosamine transferase